MKTFKQFVSSHKQQIDDTLTRVASKFVHKNPAEHYYVRNADKLIVSGPHKEFSDAQAAAKPEHHITYKHADQQWSHVDSTGKPAGKYTKNSFLKAASHKFDPIGDVNMLPGASYSTWGGGAAEGIGLATGLVKDAISSSKVGLIGGGVVKSVAAAPYWKKKITDINRDWKTGHSLRKSLEKHIDLTAANMVPFASTTTAANLATRAAMIGLGVTNPVAVAAGGALGGTAYKWGQFGVVGYNRWKGNKKKGVPGISTYMESTILDKKTLSPTQLAAKHGVPLSHIVKQLKAGVKVEHEHSSNSKIAFEIASDHIGEDPNYYTKLKKMESK
jgi:hypothetical protein